MPGAAGATCASGAALAAAIANITSMIVSTMARLGAKLRQANARACQGLEPKDVDRLSIATMNVFSVPEYGYYLRILGHYLSLTATEKL